MAKHAFGSIVSAIQHVVQHGQVEDGPINWSVLAPAPNEDLLVPTYGFYGGPNYADGVVLGPGDTATFTHDPLDSLDAAAEAHDLAYESASDPVRATADIALLDAIRLIGDDQLTPEGHLYAAAATFVILANLSQYPAGTLTPQQTLYLTVNTPAYIADATANLTEAGLEPAPAEKGALVHWLKGALDALSAINPDLVGSVIDALTNGAAGARSDAFDFSGLGHAADPLPVIPDLPGLERAGAEFPHVAFEHLPDVLADLPQPEHDHISDWLFA